MTLWLCIGKQLEWLQKPRRTWQKINRPTNVIAGFDFKPAKLVHLSTELTSS